MKLKIGDVVRDKGDGRYEGVVTAVDYSSTSPCVEIKHIASYHPQGWIHDSRAQVWWYYCKDVELISGNALPCECEKCK